MRSVGRGRSVSELLREGILALMESDAVALEELAAEASQVGQGETGADKAAARDGLRTLAALLGLTQRNLRLLRGEGRKETAGLMFGAKGRDRIAVAIDVEH